MPDLPPADAIHDAAEAIRTLSLCKADHEAAGVIAGTAVRAAAPLLVAATERTMTESEVQALKERFEAARHGPVTALPAIKPEAERRSPSRNSSPPTSSPATARPATATAAASARCRFAGKWQAHDSQATMADTRYPWVLVQALARPRRHQRRLRPLHRTTSPLATRRDRQQQRYRRADRDRDENDAHTPSTSSDRDHPARAETRPRIHHQRPAQHRHNQPPQPPLRTRTIRLRQGHHRMNHDEAMRAGLCQDRRRTANPRHQTATSSHPCGLRSLQAAHGRLRRHGRPDRQSAARRDRTERTGTRGTSSLPGLLARVAPAAPHALSTRTP